jgi:hypothetical protein
VKLSDLPEEDGCRLWLRHEPVSIPAPARTLEEYRAIDEKYVPGIRA